MLTVNKDAKTIKGLKYGYITGILYLQPSVRTCPFASKGCRESCLNTAGMGRFDNVQLGRSNKTAKILKKDYTELIQDIIKLDKSAESKGLIPCVRLNGTSDLVWSNIIAMFPDIQFYDYTKDWNRRAGFSNYHLTYSATEHTTDDEILDKIVAYENVAIVFDKVPETYLGVQVVDGDVNDLRFLDPLGVIVGLKAKGRAKKDLTGFVRRV